MRSLTKLDDWSRSDVDAVFDLADDYRDRRGPTMAGTAVMFFPSTSLRTRVTFRTGRVPDGPAADRVPRHHAGQAGSVVGRRAVPGGVGGHPSSCAITTSPSSKVWPQQRHCPW
ncbi:hypothetical protein Q9Q99_09570 [Curtobacterium flaccumfaciens]|nr:hypothetical protein Q9Q99_09570 [Curtobacterium flaccumfaciens]